MDTENKEYLLGPLDPNDNFFKISIKGNDFGDLTKYLGIWLRNRYENSKTRYQRGSVHYVPDRLPKEFEFSDFDREALWNLGRYKKGEDLHHTFRECYDNHITRVDARKDSKSKDEFEIYERWKEYPTIIRDRLKELPDYDELRADSEILHELREKAESCSPVIDDFKIWVNSNFTEPMWKKMLNARKQHKHRRTVRKKSVDINYETWRLIDNIKREENVTFDDALVLVCKAYQKQLGK